MVGSYRPCGQQCGGVWPNVKGGGHMGPVVPLAWEKSMQSCVQGRIQDFGKGGPRLLTTIFLQMRTRNVFSPLYEFLGSPKTGGGGF